MNAFLIISSNGVSEFITEFVNVQIAMNDLEKSGIVSNVRVQKFVNSILVGDIAYNYDGEQWVKI